MWSAVQLWDATAITLRRDEGRWAAPVESESAARTIYLCNEHTDQMYSEHTDQLCDRGEARRNYRIDKRSKCNADHSFNNCVYDWNERSDKHGSKYKFKVKDKWLESTNFIDGVYYQGELELCFYSFDRPDLSRNSGYCSRIETEGYYAKLGNVKQIEIED